MRTTDGPRSTPCVELGTDPAAHDAETTEPDQACGTESESVPEEAGYGHGV